MDEHLTSPGEALLEWFDRQEIASADVRIYALSGPQGSGKTTATAALLKRSAGRVAVLSLDDFYLGKAQRLALVKDVHPLFSTRGPPGTHDIALLCETLEALQAAGPETRIVTPKFEKILDDRAPRRNWGGFTGRPESIIIEGWCLGAVADSNSPRSAPINEIERLDTNGAWRGYQESALEGPYAQLWDRFAAFLHFSAPDFGVVLQWRLQQEAGIVGCDPRRIPEERVTWVTNFVMHYERITKRMMSGARRSGECIALDAQRRPIGHSRPSI